MKWPNTITSVRHGESAYNVLKALKNEDEEYKKFKKAFNRHNKTPEDAAEARELAEKLIKAGSFILNVGDHDTGLTERGRQQAEVTGAKLAGKIVVPDVVLVSPYDRTQETLDCMIKGWPELGDVRRVKEERLREQEHGLSILYNDWKIFHIMHPEQEQLYNLQGPYWYRYPQGENVPDVRERDRSLIGTYTRDYSGQNILEVTHHLQLLSRRANIERLDADGFRDLDENYKPKNCGVTIYRGDPTLGSDGKLVMDTYNEVLYGSDLAA